MMRRALLPLVATTILTLGRIRMTKLESLEHLLKVAGSSAGQGAPVRRFLGAWEQTSKYGGFDVRDLGWIDDRITDAMLNVMVSITDGQKERPMDYAKVWAPNLLASLEAVLQERLEEHENEQSRFAPAPSR